MAIVQKELFGLVMVGLVFVYCARGEDERVEVKKECNSVSVSAHHSDMILLRKAAAHRQRRIIQNSDGDDIRDLVLGRIHAPCTKDNYLKIRCKGLEGSQVDAISYCWNSAIALLDHNSFTETDLKEQAPLWNNGKVEIDSKAAWALLSQSMNIVVEFAHQHKMELFWSVRMNDNHDSYYPRLFSKWKKNHPECLMGSKGDYFPYGGGAWSTLDYSSPEVRDKIFSITKDICMRYDIDGIELDFFRHPIFFKPQMAGQPVTQDYCDMMTDLLRRIRQMTEALGENRKKPLLVIIHIPDSLGYNKATGLDIRQWLKEDLVDIVVGGGYFILEPWENLVSLGKEYNVPVYACLSADRVGFSDKNNWVEDIKRQDLYNEAARAWRAGVDGIYTFNYFSPRDKMWNVIGSLLTIENYGYDSEYQPKAFGSSGHEFFLKGGSRYAYMVKINARQDVFTDSTLIEMEFPDSQYDIVYTLDGTQPNSKSKQYNGPFTIEKTTTISAIALNKHGVKSWPSQQKFIKARDIVFPIGSEFPVKMFGLPVGSELKLDYNIPAFPQTAEFGLYLTMRNVHAQKEVRILINGQGPLFAPKEILSYHRSLSATLPLPTAFVRPGKNQINVIFADNLNGQTGGFYIEKAPLLLLFY
ncbi:MAG: hypothetical protein A2Y12_09800 [Planctomycetes bacterium GWF2_42_9]|nr:MAG: hypothetical protein A2Y12_09800 [Planctomycetes bacterium GWF2_42_9]